MLPTASRVRSLLLTPSNSTYPRAGSVPLLTPSKFNLPASRVRFLLLTPSNSTYRAAGSVLLLTPSKFNLPASRVRSPTHTVQFNLAAYNIDRYLNGRLVVSRIFG